MSFNPSSPGEGLEQFFDKIWGNVEGLVYIARKIGPADQPIWRKAFFKWYLPEGRKQLLDVVQTANAQGAEVYFSPAIWSEPKISKETFKGTNVLWADFDGSAPEWGEGPAPTDAEAASGAVPGPPTIEVQSSSEGHRHVYWALDSLATDVDFIQNVNRSIAYKYGADTSGWDAEQILRPPFTTNHKRGMPVLVARFDETRYNADQFKGFKPVVQLVKDNLDLDAIPDPVVVIASYPWESDTRELLNRDSLQDTDRSAAMMRIAYYCAERGMSDAEAYSILFWLDEKWGKFKHRNDRVKRLLDLVNKARQKHPHAVEDPTFAGLQNGKVDSPSEIQYHWTGRDFLSADIRVSWAFKGLLQEKGIGLIVSPGGHGKSQISLQLAAAAALNKPFLDYVPTRQLKSGILSLEMGPPRLFPIWSTICGGYTPEDLDVFHEKIVLSPLGEHMPLNSTVAKDWLKNYIKDYGIELLVVDSIGKVLEDMQDDVEVRRVMGFLQSLNVTVFAIHHTRKEQSGNKSPKDLSDVYGSQYITSEADTVISVYRKEKNLLEWRDLKNRMAEESEPFMIRRVEHLQFVKETIKREEEPTFDGLQPSTVVNPPPNGNPSRGNMFG